MFRSLMDHHQGVHNGALLKLHKMLQFLQIVTFYVLIDSAFVGKNSFVHPIKPAVHKTFDIILPSTTTISFIL